MRLLLLSILLSSSLSYGQFFEPSDTLNKKRLVGTAIVEGAGWGSSIFLLNHLWYQYFPRTSFHFFNDNPEWLQMDKAGHVMTSYYMGRVGYNTLRWTGLDKKRSLWYGGLLGSGYLLSMEILDAFSKEWGFSWGDVLANAGGTALFMTQEQLWDEQRITVKFSSHLTEYATYRPQLLGFNAQERLMKDYNGHTYWLSFNLQSFMKKHEWMPDWLNVAIGYGAEEMVSGRPEDNTMYPDLFNRYRQWYFSPDIDFTKIPTKQKWLKPILHALNLVKVPMPTLEVSKRGVNGYFFYF